MFAAEKMLVWQAVKSIAVTDLAAGNTPISCSYGLKGFPSSNLISIDATSVKSAANGAKW
jgi:hypothetical protein